MFLAGDYLGSYYTETAIQTGFTAAQSINSFLDFELPASQKEKKFKTAVSN
ncbi:hypothetical protein RCO48_17280 [Peribacillus frigoritolerans]|nr:hypothetical protein [Peribacillus frigoritolerans]